MYTCYVCDDILNSENETVEHIVLNAIGGKLKSRRLICRDCNSKFGSKIDTELAKQLSSFCTLLNIQRESGTPVYCKIKVQTSAKNLYRVLHDFCA